MERKEGAWSDREFRSHRSRSRWNTRACAQRGILIKYFHVFYIFFSSFFLNLSIDASLFFFFFFFFFRVWCISSRTMMMEQKRATSNARRDYYVCYLCSAVINNNLNIKNERGWERLLRAKFFYLDSNSKIE
jgi:hypothetical protein